MSHARGFSVRIQRDTRIGIGLTRTGKTSWLVDNLTVAAAEEPLPDAFRRAISEQGGDLAWIVPDEQVRTVLITMPSLKGRELKRGVLGMAARQEKCSPDELVVSWRSLGTRVEPGGEPGMDLVSLVMARGDRDEHLQLAESMGVKPTCLLPGYSILDQMFRLAGPPVPDGGAWTLVYLGRQENFLNISSPESLLLTRTLPANLSDDQDPTDYLERLATEIDRSRFFIRQGANNPEIRQVVVCGEPELAVSLVEHLNAEGSIAAVHWAAEHLFSHEGEASQTEFLIPLLGAALALESPRHNLLDRRRRRFLGRRGRRRLMLAGTAAAVGMVPMIMAGSVLTARIQETYLTRARQRLETARIEAQQAAEIYKTNKLLSNQELCLDWLDHRRLDVESLLSQLADAAPEKVVFRNMRVWEGEDGSVRLEIIGDSKGSSSEEAQATYLAFQQSLVDLKALEGFREPRVLEIESVRKGGSVTPMTRFTLDLEIAPRAPEAS